MPHKNRVRRQTHVGSAPELLGEIEITCSFGTFPESKAKLFPSRGGRDNCFSRPPQRVGQIPPQSGEKKQHPTAPHGGQQGTDQLRKKSRNRPAQVHSTSTARWRFCHPIFSQVDGQIGRRRLKRVLPFGLFFADSTKNFRHRRHRRHRWVYASRERHGSMKDRYSKYFLEMPHSMQMYYSHLL